MLAHVICLLYFLTMDCNTTSAPSFLCEMNERDLGKTHFRETETDVGNWEKTLTRITMKASGNAQTASWADFRAVAWRLMR